MNRADRRTAAKSGDWGNWVETQPPVATDAFVENMARTTGYSAEEVRATIASMRHNELAVKNYRYQVNIRRVASPGGAPMIHLSIKRRDGAPSGIERFRDFMRIKDELVGPEHEAVELYPAQSRLADSANQYHLWVLEQPGERFPFGFSERLVLGHKDVAGTGIIQQTFKKR